eukprot:9657346-Alexandrium_andersonii.AAC.1
MAEPEHGPASASHENVDPTPDMASDAPMPAASSAGSSNTTSAPATESAERTTRVVSIREPAR